MRSFYLLHQGQDSTQTYYEKFNAAIDVIKEMGGNIGTSHNATNYALELSGIVPTSASNQQRAAAAITGAEIIRLSHSHWEPIESDSESSSKTYPTTTSSVTTIAPKQ